MPNLDEIRWQQRLENFTKALVKLAAAAQKESYSELELAGLVQMFEVSFELSWKTLKDLLFYEGAEANSPREVIRKAFELGYLPEGDAESMLDAMIKRNLLSHTYNEATAKEAESLIKAKYTPMLLALCRRLELKRKP